MIPENERYAQAAARLMARQLPNDPHRPARIDRDTMVSSMVEAIEGRARRKKWAVGGTVLALAACAVIAVQVAKRTPREEVGTEPLLVPSGASNDGHILIRKGVSLDLQGPTAIAKGDRLLMARERSSSLQFADGTKADIEQKSEVAIANLGSERNLRLERGRLDLHVAKLGRNQRFKVTTPDSVIEVHGTVFSVAVNNPTESCPGEFAATRVSVIEGVVSVEHLGRRVYLYAGETWPKSETKPQDPVTPAQVGVPMIRAPRSVPHRIRSTKQAQVEVRKESDPPVVAVQSPSNLAEQNDLFAGALAAERREDFQLALRKLEELLQKFPGGPLDESARAERKKLLQTLSR